jgi:hypothetical protein
MGLRTADLTLTSVPRFGVPPRIVRADGLRGELSQLRQLGVASDQTCGLGHPADLLQLGQADPRAGQHLSDFSAKPIATQPCSALTRH